jgi:hypothetical protein
MSNRKHHFVPQFYLRAFNSAPKRINIYNLTQGREIEGASLRDQCYKHRFYGKTDDLEKHLAYMEGMIAPVLQAIQRDIDLPKPGSEARDLIVVFVALQLLRTSIAAEKINAQTDKMMKQVYRDDPRLAGVDLDAVKVGFKDAVLISLNGLIHMIYALRDLKTHLICADDTQFFLTSDNPIFKYNKYCEGARGTGTTGAAMRGFQVFVPLSPKVLLMLYDSTVYKVGQPQSDISYRVSNEDIAALNILQVVNAERNLFFSDWRDLSYIRKLVQKGTRFRNKDLVQVEEFVEVGNAETSSLIHSYEPMVNLQLNLSFLSIKRNARRVPLYERTQDMRVEVPLPEYPNPRLQERSAGTRVFRRPHNR